jgi:hypothetical protein
MYVCVCVCVCVCAYLRDWCNGVDLSSWPAGTLAKLRACRGVLVRGGIADVLAGQPRDTHVEEYCARILSRLASS